MKDSNLTLYRQTLLAASVAFLTAFCLYVRTLSPAFHPDDSPETITAGATLSHQHPPGYPLHSLLGRVSVLANPNPKKSPARLSAALAGFLARAPFRTRRTQKSVARVSATFNV